MYRTAHEKMDEQGTGRYHEEGEKMVRYGKSRL
jgi:hypothetical protein